VCHGDNKIFIVGGNTENGEVLSNLEMLDLSCSDTNSIVTDNILYNCGNMKYKRSNPVCSYYKGSVYICGGEYGMMNVE